MRKAFLRSVLILGLCSCSDRTENPLENLCSNADLAEAVRCLKAQPQEDIMAIPAVSAYLKEHKVYVSFTTSPDRIGNAIWMLQTLNLEHVEAILLALPEKYKNKIPYDNVPADIANFPKLQIIARNEKDVGPATKILYALDLVSKKDPDAIVISIDDDTGLPWGAIDQLIKYAVLYPNAVVGGSGRYAGLFGIMADEWLPDAMTEKAPYCGHGEVSYCHVLEGYKGIAYKPRLVDVKQVAKLVESSKYCLTSDDLVISYALAQNNVERIRVSSPYFYKVGQFKFGFEGDALHRLNSGYPDDWKPHKSWAGLVGVSKTADRYQRCAYDLKAKKNT